MSISESVQVAVAVIYDDLGNILISKRSVTAHKGGLWEFPGGKIEVGEDVETALSREIWEELGIRVLSSKPLISIPFDYGDKQVHLHVHQVVAFTGQAYGRENQLVRWVSLSQCEQYNFPEANHYILKALQLPHCYYITPEPDSDLPTYLSQLQTAINNQAKLIQFRAKLLRGKKYQQYAFESIKLCREKNVKLLLNSDIETAMHLGADGVHVSSEILMSCKQRTIPDNYLFAASCHNLTELKKAQSIAADFVVLGAVQITKSHPDADILGWKTFSELVKRVRMPVFALGGLSPSDLSVAQRNGGQGIAAIRSLWTASR